MRFAEQNPGLIGFDEPDKPGFVEPARGLLSLAVTQPGILEPTLGKIDVTEIDIGDGGDPTEPTPGRVVGTLLKIGQSHIISMGESIGIAERPFGLCNPVQIMVADSEGEIRGKALDRVRYMAFRGEEFTLPDRGRRHRTERSFTRQSPGTAE